MDFAQLELGPKMSACSERERKFVWLYVTGEGNATEAAKGAGYSDASYGSLKVQAHSLMHRERVLLAIEEVGRKAFRGLLVPTIKATRRVLDKPDHPDHMRAVNSMWSRLGYGERTGVDVNVSGEVTVSHTEEAVLQLKAMLQLGVPREKLIELFGFSGLQRYEDLLREREARSPKLIEGEVVSRETKETGSKG